MPFPSFMSQISQKPREILIFKLSWQNSKFLPVFYCKWAILEVDHVCDYIMMSYIGCLYLFWYLWKEETHSYTMEPILTNNINWAS